MQVEIAEAFKYNSCKKIAQLCRVALELRDERIDDFVERKAVISKYETRIKKIEKNEIRRNEKMQNELLQYRKECIDNCCVVYGAQYKQLKFDFAELIESYRQKFMDIAREIKDQKQIMINTEKLSLKQAAELLDSTEFETKELESQGGRSQLLSRKEISDYDKQFRIKVSKKEKESNEKMRIIQENFSKMALELRKDLNERIRKIIGERRYIFVGYKERLSELSSDVQELKKEHQVVIKNRSEIMSIATKFRKRMNEEMRNQTKQNQAQMREMQKQGNNANRDIESEKLEVQKKMRMNHSAFEKKMASLQVQINRQRTLKNQLKDRMKTAKREKIQAESSIKRENEKEIKLEKMKLNEERQKIQAVIDENFKGACEMRDSTKKFVDHSLVVLTKHKNNLADKLAKQASTNPFTKEMEFFTNTVASIDAFFTQEIQQQSKDSKEALKVYKRNLSDEKHSLKNLLDTVQKETNSAMQNSKAQTKKKISESERIISDQFTKINNMLRERKSLNEEKLKRTKEKFAADVSEKKQQIEDQRNIPDMLKETVKEDENFVKQKTLLSQKLQLIEVDINTAKSTNTKRCEMLDNEIASEEKRKRKIKRAIEAETKSIADKFETEIQVAQVKLHESLDNLSLLYDADQNQRGNEIITVVRMIRECNSFVQERQAQQNRLFYKMRKEQKKEMDSIQENIDKLKNNERIKELEGELKMKEEEKENSLKALNNNYDEQIVELKAQIEREKHEFDEEIKATKQKIKEEDEKYQQRCEEMNSKVDKMNEEKKENLLKSKNVYQNKFADNKESHGKKVKELKSTIDANKSRMKETMKELNAAVNEEKNKLLNEENKRSQREEENLKIHLESLSIIDREQELTDKIESNCNHVSSLLEDFNRSNESLSFNTKLFSLSTDASQKSEAIDNMFERIIEVLSYSQADYPTERRIVSQKTSRQKITRPSSGVKRV